MNISITNLNASYNDVKIFDSLDLHVPQGECICISGQSGSGKSYLFSVLAGLVPELQQHINIDGQSVAEFSGEDNQLFRKHLGVVFQRPALLSNLNLQENLLLPLNKHYQNWSLERKMTQINALMAEFKLTGFMSQRTHFLSAGQGSLAAFARAITGEKRCLIWDSPMVDVDEKWNRLVTAKLTQLKDSGTTIILFTNRRDLSSELADKHYELVEGKLQNVI